MTFLPHYEILWPGDISATSSSHKRLNLEGVLGCVCARGFAAYVFRLKSQHVTFLPQSVVISAVSSREESLLVVGVEKQLVVNKTPALSPALQALKYIPRSQ